MLRKCHDSFPRSGVPTKLYGVALPFAKPFTPGQTNLYVARIVFIHRHPRSRFNLA
jgi:hypothetical protein